MSNGKRTAESIFGGKSHGHPDFKREEKKQQQQQQSRVFLKTKLRFLHKRAKAR